MSRLGLVVLAFVVLAGCQDITQPPVDETVLGAPLGLAPPAQADKGLANADAHNGDHPSDHSVFGRNPTPFPAGYAGSDVRISIGRDVQTFTSSALQATPASSSTQDATGVVRLAVPQCTACNELAAVRALLPGSFPSGTRVTFDVSQVVGLPAPNTSAHCRLDRLPTYATISGTYFPIDGAGSVGSHVVTLPADEPDGIVLHCEVTIRGDVPGL